MAIGTRADYKVFVGIPSSDTSEDAKIDLLLTYAYNLVKDYCHQDFEDTTVLAGQSSSAYGAGDSGYYNGDETRFLRLRITPVRTLTAIYLDYTGRFGQNPDGSFASATLLTSGTDYELVTDGTLPGTSTRVSYRGMVERVGGVWPGVRRYKIGTLLPQVTELSGCIRVDYVGGYTAATVPPALVFAVYSMVSFMRRNADKGSAISNENLASYGYGISQAALDATPELASTRQALAKYRRLVI